MTNDNHLHHCSVALLISSWLLMLQLICQDLIRWSMSVIFSHYTSC